MITEKVNAMTIEEAINLLTSILKTVSETNSDTKLGKKVRKQVVDFGMSKYKIKNK
jgi:hypothetical protein